MEWLTCIRKTIEYIEEHITDDICVQDVSDQVNISSMFLQKGFSIMTGFTVTEYIRNRRLYQAAIDLISGNEKIIDIAYTYCYETPESFTKAFTRFHGATPTQIRMKEAPIQSFLPLKINISIQGGYHMEYKIVTMNKFQVLGFARDYSFEEAQEKIPGFWTEVFETHMKEVLGKEPTTDKAKALLENHVGEFGICIDDEKKKCLRYLIAGKYMGGYVPEGMDVITLPEGDWAVFECYGPMPNALQSLTNKIFKEWLPGNPDYEINGSTSVEWYDSKNMDNTSSNYHSQIWLPIRRK